MKATGTAGGVAVLVAATGALALNFDEVSLEEALNMEVSTVSKRSERISDAPAVITVITAEQIEELGAQSLPEVMSYVPGFSLTDTYWKPAIVTARGVKMNMYNDKILMLIDGVPAYDGAGMEHYLDTVPVPAIDRIEVIRGPGSVLYGTNAFSAVINVITKDAADQPEMTGFLKGGSFGDRETGLAFGHVADGVEYFFAGTTRDDDGYSKYAVDEGGAANHINYERDNDAFFGSVKAGGLELSGGYLFQKYGKYGPAPGFTGSPRS
jgi:outer membrane cobalamin receptor